MMSKFVRLFISPSRNSSTGIPCMITVNMKSHLFGELQYTNENIREMTPSFAAEIIKENRKKEADVSDDEFLSILDYYKENNELPPDNSKIEK